MPLDRSTFRNAFVVLVAALAAGCTSAPREVPEELDITTRMLGKPDASAVALLRPVPGSGVEGRVSFLQFGPSVVVRANFVGLQPNREYGLHVHDKGDCRAPDGSSAGGHFNPGGGAHGRPGSGTHHAGDLPNLRTDGEGNVTYLFETRALSIGSGAANLIGRSVIVSRDRDDYRTQPDGNAGPPLACGFIRPD